MSNVLGPTVEILRQARQEGFHSFMTLERDEAFAGLRAEPEFQQELQEACRVKVQADQLFHHYWP
jgi:hypothetical protein